MPILIDSYSESNVNTYTDVYNGSFVALGQSFTNTFSDKLGSVVFYLKKLGSPTGNITASVYAHTGTYGTSSKPTGTALATSSAIDISTLTTSAKLITFNFTGVNQIVLSSSTHYVAVINFSGGDDNNALEVGVDISTPTAPGNMSIYFPPWIAFSNQDIAFYVYAADIATSKLSKIIKLQNKIPYSILFCKICHRKINENHSGFLYCKKCQEPKTKSLFFPAEQIQTHKENLKQLEEKKKVKLIIKKPKDVWVKLSDDR